ncbi:aromatic alcohol reductase [Hyalangium gracile]|uniref:aromatic alcohol reductase n=1 Tax=Hyalangium gracile TaxID=394092 RepID=UPI001CD00FB1|nr:aromatic alcohol reductase [Hyalangium gracile]
MPNPPIVLAGATGDLGGRIARELTQRGASVRALVRPGTPAERTEALRKHGVSISEVNLADATSVARACEGAPCVVSALSGLREVIIDAQGVLLEGAVKAGVPRFIPSDFSIDFTRLPAGSNRNLDLRREFHTRLERAPIAATSIFNGMFTDLLVGPAPMILFRFHRVLFWGSAEQRLPFTTIQDTAAFTALAAMDSQTPRVLRVAGDVLDARGLAAVATEVTGERFQPLRAGGLGRLGAMIRVMRILGPGRHGVFPPWQGMQYMHNMFSGLAPIEPLDNERYPGLRWTSVRDVLAENEPRRRRAGGKARA